MGDVTGIAVIWAGRCCGGARYSAHAPADRRTDASTTPAARDRANYSPSARADQTAAQRPIGGVVRIREGCRRQHQSGADHACYCRLLCHSRSTEKPGSGAGFLIPLPIELQLSAPSNEKQLTGGCSSSSCRAGAFARPVAALGLAYHQLRHHPKKHALTTRGAVAADPIGVDALA
jgi:hypothetical protein